jgi:hypothetical protein
MFRKNSPHLQIPPTGHVDELPEFLPDRLRNSWAETFYREFFCRLDEQPFDVLYAEEPSRPNVPVNVLVGLEFLKAAKGWADEELDNEFCYNVQVRYALGYRPLGKGYFDLRTLYDFRERLARHMQERGGNLLEQAFEQVPMNNCGLPRSRPVSSGRIAPCRPRTFARWDACSFW